jgi:hypothetical protein
MFKAIFCTATAVFLGVFSISTGASATDLGKPRKRADVCERAWTNAQAHKKDPKQYAALLRRYQQICAPVVVKSPPAVPVMAPPRQPVASACGYADEGFWRSGIHGYVVGSVGGTWKDMKDGNTGVDKTTLGFFTPEIGGGLCYTFAPMWSAKAEIGYAFGLNTEHRSYPGGGIQESDKLQLLTARLGVMRDLNQTWSIGAHGALAWGWMEQTVDVPAAGFSRSSTATGTFLGLGPDVEYRLNRDWSVTGRYEHLWSISNSGCGCAKPEIDRFDFGVKRYLN